MAQGKSYSCGLYMSASPVQADAPIQTSVFEIFKIGLGPSSSHTTGPMIAAAEFRAGLLAADTLPRVVRLEVRLHGSLGATGRGHATDKAVIAGLSGQSPTDTSSQQFDQVVRQVCEHHELVIGHIVIRFDPASDIQWLPATRSLPHPNTLDIIAFDESGRELLQRRYLSVGGGFVESMSADGTRALIGAVRSRIAQPRHRFSNAADLRKIGLDWWQIALENEMAMFARSEAEVFQA